MINVEIKARARNSEGIKRILDSGCAVYHGRDHQVDTYFNFDCGKLKLRSGNIENSLIYYERENKKWAKKSSVLLGRLTPDNGLVGLLSKIFGIEVIVDKEREIYYINNVKFHLDEVKDLGRFVEIEAIDKDDSIGEGTLLEQCEFYKHLFGIREEDLVAGSYSDLLLKISADISKVDNKIIK